MLEFILSQLLLYTTFFLVLFVPGAFLLLATKMYKRFSSLELFVLSFGSSFAIVDFIAIILGRSPFLITRLSLITGIILFSSICFGIFWKYNRDNHSIDSVLSEIPKRKMSKRGSLLMISILFLSIFIKTFYLKDAIFPTATDLGHHMYWTKQITLTGELPIYQESDISQNNTIEGPTPIADFIIGEHLVLASIAIISGADFFSSFPVLTLFLVHIISIFTIFIVARSFFDFKEKNSSLSETIAILALLLIGPLYSLASPQAKFISGGVIGNDIGNLLIPLLVLLYLKAFNKKDSSILAFAIFLSLGLAYTHHLSTFVFIFISIFTVFIYAVFNLKTIFSDLKVWIGLFFSKEVLAVVFLGIISIIFLYTPTYLNVKAVDTAVGAPSKATRTGLTLDQFKSTAGEARFALAFLGIILLSFTKKLKRYNKVFLMGWIISLTLMSLFPGLLFIDIPSNRVASYIVFPVSIISAYMLALLFLNLKEKVSNKNYLNPSLLLICFFILISFIATNGLYDNALSLNTGSSSSPALQTYAASKYVADNSDNKDVVLKDHNYLSGDAWIKLYFMRGYNYPFSRGFFKRYQDETKPREQCTNLMISTPNIPAAQKCFEGTGTNFIMVDPRMDSAQFRRINDFWQIYSADDITVFHKAN
ncbi:MAG: hypothetical protein ACD_5C00268G0005 [uncultured bacterium]|nr:MAG: hypothetical protein ACD_5C00268G0005 [uncultured bacterium]